LRICHSRAWLPREAAFFAVLSAAKEIGRAATLHFVQGGRKRPSRIPAGLFCGQVSPFPVGRFNLDLALAANSLVDIIEFFEVDEPVDVIASRE
jgi:hypothetical protein